MRSESDVPPPPGPADSLHRRRVYFEQLTKLLVAAGVEGDEVGRLVAELDAHVADAAADPVDELGPVGELAASLRSSLGPRRFVPYLVGSLVFSVALALALGTALPLLWPLPDAEGPVIWVGLVVYAAVFTVGVALLWGFGGRSLRGRRTLEIPKLWFVVFVVATVAVFTTTQDLVWEVSTPTAVMTLLISGPVAAVALVWSVRRTRVRVPGNATHLHRLGWGPLGRVVPGISVRPPSQMAIAGVAVCAAAIVLGGCGSEVEAPSAQAPAETEVDLEVRLDELLILERDRIAELLRHDHPETFSYVSVDGEVLEIGMVGGHLPVDQLTELTSYSPVEVVESPFSSEQLDGWAEELLDQLGEADGPALVGVIAHHQQGTIELLTPEPGHPGLAAAVDAMDGLPTDIVEIVDARGSGHPYLDPGSPE